VLTRKAEKHVVIALKSVGRWGFAADPNHRLISPQYLLHLKGSATPQCIGKGR